MISRILILVMALVAPAGTKVPALAAGPGPGRADQDLSKTTPRDATKSLEPLAVVGFRAGEQLAARDTWVPLAVEETLAWRLRRIPGLVVVPATRIRQARHELTGAPDDPPAEWSRVVRLLGAKLWLRGSCEGTPDALALNLELIRVKEAGAKPARLHVGPGRLFEVVDQATRWALQQLGVTRIDKKVEQLVLAPPAASPSALEYYSKALASARSENLRDGAYYAAQALGYDPAFRPALLLLAKIELRASSTTRVRAAIHLRLLKQLAAQSNDAIDEAEFELTQGVFQLATGSSAAGRQRFESSLASAFARADPYGQLAAMDALCEWWLSNQPPAGSELSAESLGQFRTQNLRRAAEWQELVLGTLRQLGDVIALVPAANKLAMLYDRLNEPALALQAYKETVSAARRTGSARNEATGWLFLGQWYRRQQRWQEALEATGRCLALVTEEGKPVVRIALAEIYREMALPREALGHYESAYEALADGDDLMNQFRCLRALAEVRMELGEREVAITRLVEALDIAQVLGLAEEQALRQQLAQWKGANP